VIEISFHIAMSDGSRSLHSYRDNAVIVKITVYPCCRGSFTKITLAVPFANISATVRSPCARDELID